VEQNGASLVFVNEAGTRSKGHFDGTDVIADDWGSLRGHLVNNNTGIQWANNTSWSR
jgi:hypothetical protein